MKKLILAIGLWLAATGIAQAQLLTTGAGGTAAVVLPLDNLTAWAAWSTRKLRTAYAGSAITVRRSSDSTTQNIGFSGNNLDTATLLSFCAATDCFVTTLFDQSGNTNCSAAACNVSQASAGQQPQIVTAGALTATINGHAVMKYISGTNLSNGAALPVGQPWSAIGVANATSGNSDNFGNNGRGLIGGGSSLSGLNFIQGSYCTACFVVYNDGSSTLDRTASVTYTYGTNGIFMGRWNASDTNPLKAYINGGTAGHGANTGQSAMGTPFFVGCHRGCGANGNTLVGTLGEEYFFNNEPSVANANALGANIGTYWGLTWTNITE